MHLFDWYFLNDQKYSTCVTHAQHDVCWTKAEHSSPIIGNQINVYKDNGVTKQAYPVISKQSSHPDHHQCKSCPKELINLKVVLFQK